MPEKRTEIVKIHEVVRTIPSHQQLMKVNRLLARVVFLLTLVVFVFGLFFVPDPKLMTSQKKLSATAIAAEGTNPAISSEVNELKGQLIGLVSGSIESKLSSLETSIKSGTVDNSLGTIADLKNDIKVLRTYSEAPKKDNVVVTNQDLSQEVTHLKHLIYATIASCGLMFVAAAGVWIKYRKRLPYKEIRHFLGKR
jgi:hypothetical protein